VRMAAVCATAVCQPQKVPPECATAGSCATAVCVRMAAVCGTAVCQSDKVPSVRATAGSCAVAA